MTSNEEETKAPDMTPILICGPSGVGKGTVIDILMKKCPTLFGFSVSNTTRAPRPGEENGVHYNFVTVPEMEAMIQNSEFIEYAKVHSNYYGTSFQAVECVKSQGKICILDLDTQGVKSVKNSCLHCKYIFIAPPSIEVLEKRLRGRRTETEDKIRIRLENAKEELVYGSEEEGNFDLYVVNGDEGAEETASNILATLQNWFPAIVFA